MFFWNDYSRGEPNYIKFRILCLICKIKLPKLFLSLFEIYYCDKMGYLVQQGLENY